MKEKENDTMNFETKRLIFKKVEIEDVNKLFKIFSNDELTKYFVSGADTHISQTEKRVKNIISHWNKYRFGDFIILDKSTKEMIGFGGLHYKTEEGNVNISYIIDTSHWKKGYGTEACQELLKYGFEYLKLNKIAGEIDPNNRASIKLIEKCGFKYNRVFKYKEIERLEYIMTREQFEKTK